LSDSQVQALYSVCYERVRTKTTGVELELSVSTPLSRTLRKTESQIACAKTHVCRIVLRKTGTTNTNESFLAALNCLSHFIHLFHPKLKPRIE